MRVANLDNRSSSSARRAGRSDGTGFSLRGAAPSASGGPLAGAGVLGSIDALAALQGLDELDGAGSADAAMIARGETLLDDLAQLRDGLLTGGLDRSALTSLKHQLARPRPQGMDPDLATILDDIELRVAVELAKQEAEDRLPEPEPPEPEAPQQATLSAAERRRLARHAYTGPR